MAGQVTPKQKRICADLGHWWNGEEQRALYHCDALRLVGYLFWSEWSISSFYTFSLSGI